MAQDVREYECVSKKGGVWIMGMGREKESEADGDGMNTTQDGENCGLQRGY